MIIPIRFKHPSSTFQGAVQTARLLREGYKAYYNSNQLDRARVKGKKGMFFLVHDTPVGGIPAEIPLDDDRLQILYPE